MADRLPEDLLDPLGEHASAAAGAAAKPPACLGQEQDRDDLRPDAHDVVVLAVTCEDRILRGRGECRQEGWVAR